MEVSLKVGRLSSAVGKQPYDPCLHPRMPDVSYLCAMTGSRTVNGDELTGESLLTNREELSFLFVLALPKARKKDQNFQTC